MDHKNTDLQLPPIEDELGTTKTSGSKSAPPKKPAGITGPNERTAMGMLGAGEANLDLDDDGLFKEEQPSKPIVAAQKSSRGRLWALLVALGVVAAGSTYLHFNGEDGDSAKGEKPSADVTTKQPEPQQSQQSPKPDETKFGDMGYHCRFNYSSSGVVRAECDGVAAGALKIVFDADASTTKNAVGQLIIDTDNNGKFGDTADVSCGITLLKPTDRTKSQQLDVVGEDGKIIGDGKLVCKIIPPKMP